MFFAIFELLNSAKQRFCLQSLWKLPIHAYTLPTNIYSVLGTSDAWLTSCLFHRPSKPAYYIANCRILNLSPFWRLLINRQATPGSWCNWPRHATNWDILLFCNFTVHELPSAYVVCSEVTKVPFWNYAFSLLVVMSLALISFAVFVSYFQLKWLHIYPAVS